jgi:hypothetical protein
LNEAKAVLMGWVDHKDRFQDASIELDVTPDRMHPLHYRPVPILIAWDRTFWQAAMTITKWVDTERHLRWVKKAQAYRQQTIFATNKGGFQDAWNLVRDSLLNLRRKQ